MLKPPYSDAWRRRFEKEVALLQRLAGAPGVVSILGAPREIGGLLSIPTAFVEGNPFSEFALPQPPHRVLELMTATIRAIAPVHHTGIIHRDLHLGNVIWRTEWYSPLDSNGHAVIVDFGQARDLDGIDYYQSFKPVGAMSYCAPEKWHDSSAAGPPSDIFSIGVMFYRLLTGKAPFWEDTYIQLYECIKRGAYPPINSIAPEVPQIFDLLVQELLYPEPERRPQNGEELLAMLDRIDPTYRLWERQQYWRAARHREAAGG